MTNEIFVSATVPSRGFGAFLEYDGTTAYFYLCRIQADADPEIVDHLWISNADFPVLEQEILVATDRPGTRIGLFIRGTLWALFNTVEMTKYGGAYSSGGMPDIPPKEQFSPLN